MFVLRTATGVGSDLTRAPRVFGRELVGAAALLGCQLILDREREPLGKLERGRESILGLLREAKREHAIDIAGNG